MNISEVRHLDEIKGNFGIADGILYTAKSYRHHRHHC